MQTNVLTKIILIITIITTTTTAITTTITNRFFYKPILVGCQSMIVWTHAVLGVLVTCMCSIFLYLHLFSTERCSRNPIIITNQSLELVMKKRRKFLPGSGVMPPPPPPPETKICAIWGILEANLKKSSTLKSITNISFVPSICIHRSIILFFAEQKKVCLLIFFPWNIFFPAIFLFSFPWESSFLQQIPGSANTIPLTTPIGIAEVGEAPHVAQTHRVAQQWHEEVKSAGPVATVIHLLGLPDQVIVQRGQHRSTGHVLDQWVHRVL